MGKILAIDYGKKRIGIAISDSKKSIAFFKDNRKQGNFSLFKRNHPK